MIAFSFTEDFIQLIVACVASPSISVNVNGTLHGFFSGACGPRKGDPLSLYLFVSCMEVLSRGLDLVTKSKSFHFHPKCSCISLNHLIFVDDFLLFSRSDLSLVQVL